MQVIDQLEAYFKVEMAVPNEQLKKDENELKAPEKEVVEEPPKQKKNRWGYLKKWFTLSAPKTPEPEEEEEDPEILATRFLSFEEGSLLVLQYLPNKPIRDYGPFKPQKEENAKPLPAVQWDA